MPIGKATIPIIIANTPRIIGATAPLAATTPILINVNKVNTTLWVILNPGLLAAKEENPTIIQAIAKIMINIVHPDAVRPIVVNAPIRKNKEAIVVNTLLKLLNALTGPYEGAL